MKVIVAVVAVVVCLTFTLVSIGHAGTEEQAKALAEKAVAYFKANGKEKAVAEFNNPKGQFVKGDMYIVLQGYDGVVYANGGNPKLTGQNHFELKDPNGKYFVKEMVETAKKGSGWVTFSWVNPLTKKVQPKKTWVQKLDGVDMYVNCGTFQ